MAKPQDADPVKLFVAVLWAAPDSLRRAMEMLCTHWGEIDFEGADYPFDSTDYYLPEMGFGLKRRLISFLKPVPADCLISAKHICNDIEDQLSGEKGRSVNLDVGYLDHNKIVLASFKGAGQKIYLKDGVWADMVARYREGRFCPFEWTFPDFRDGRYDREFIHIRQVYLKQLRGRPLPR
ncbi:MAG: DUF4416 family protein [Acidobacteriota bacterium]|nr:DUF4416 family protein [Acidobacteriota bacterium]